MPSVAAVFVHARMQSPLSDPDFSLHRGNTSQFMLSLGNCHVSATEVWERAELSLLFFESAYFQLKYACAVFLNSITCLRNTAQCNIESKQPPIGGCFDLGCISLSCQVPKSCSAQHCLQDRTRSAYIDFYH